MTTETTDGATTERARYHFVVQISDHGPPWLLLELAGDQPLSLLSTHDGYLGLELAPGTTRTAAQAVARRLNVMVTGVTHTRFAAPDDDGCAWG